VEVASVKVISIDELNSNGTFELVMTKSWESNNDRKNPISKTNRTAWITLAILSFTQIITMHSETMLLPAIPDIIVDFNLSFNNSSWILSSYLIAGAVSAPIVGRLSDIYGSKKMLVIIMQIYMFGITMGGFSSDFTSLIVSRIIQGIGISMLPTAFGIIKGQFPQEKLSIAVGIFTSMSAVGSVVGLVIGASIIENLGWRATFFSIIPVSIVLWFVIRRFIYDDQKISEVVGNDSKDVIAFNNSGNRFKKGMKSSDDQTRSIDVKGVIALSATITSFLMALSFFDTNDVTSSIQIIIFMSIGIISLMLFVIIERKSDYPIVNLQLLTNKFIISANIILALIFLTKFAIFQTIPVIVRSPEPLGFGGGALDIAGIQFPFMIVFLLFAPSSGVIISRLGSAKPTILGAIITVIGCFGLFAFHSTGYLVSANLAIIAAGISLMQVGSMNIILESTPRQFGGISLGMTVIFKMVGSSIGPVIAGLYMQANQATLVGVGGSFPSPVSYTLIFLTLSLISIITVTLSIFIKRRLALAPPFVAEGAR
jgi:MFS family permease